MKLDGLGAQPISRVEWVHRDELHANDYNPNQVFPPELRLLKISILEDGWTAPIVARRDGEIVDGYHRWLVSDDKKLRDLTDGYVPVVYLDDTLDPAQQRMATIRHNRARGSHYVVKMADIVEELVTKYDLAPEEIEKRLQMEDEEVSRLLDHGRMTKRGRQESFNSGWIISSGEDDNDGTRRPSSP